IVFVRGRLWVIQGHSLFVVDPSALVVDDPRPFELGPGFVADDESGVWATEFGRSEVFRLDADSGAVMDAVALDGDPRAIEFAADALWVTDVANDRVIRIDPVQRRVVAAIPVGAFPASIATN